MWLRSPTFWVEVLKVAVTCSLALSVKVQVALEPLQPPVHPVKDELAPAASVRVISVPALKLALQVGAQLIPEGLLETVPVPVPVELTLNA